MSFTPEQADANRAEDQANLLSFMLRHPLGRQYIWERLEEAGIFKTSFAGENSHTTSFNEGQRNMGLRMLNDVMRFDANSLTLMKAEDTERQTRYHVIAPERDDYE